MDDGAEGRLAARLRILAIVYLLAYGIFYVGMWFHRSQRPQIAGLYTLGYLAFLIALLIPFAVPFLLRRVARQHGTRAVLFVLVPVGVLTMAGWGIGHIVYDYTREYAFDPYLQLFSEPLETQHPVDKSEGVLRVVTLGGSTTRNHRLEFTDRYPRVLERRLREAHPDRKIEVINAGQNWWTTKHSLINYTTYASDWAPDVVVVMHGINDVEKSLRSADFTIGEYSERWTHHYASAANAAHAPTFEQFVLRSLRGLTDKWFSALRFEEVDFPLAKYRSIGPFETNLARIVRYARADGAEVVLVSQPSMYREDLPPEDYLLLQAPRYMREPKGALGVQYPSVAALARVMKAFNAATRRVAEAEGTVFVDGAAAVPKTSEHHIDGVHYTPAGAIKIAESVQNGVEEALRRRALRTRTATVAP